MSLQNSFYAKTRLALICRAICVSDKSGTLIFMNKCFRSLARRVKPFRLKDYSEFSSFEELVDNATEVHEMAFGKRDVTLASTPMRILDQASIMYVDAEACDSIFPIVYFGQIYYALETVDSRIVIPIFGGMVYSRTEDNRLAEIGTIPCTGLQYFCIRKLLMSLVPELADEAEKSGCCIDFDPFVSSNAVCYANDYDLALVIELLISTVIPHGDNKRVMVSIEDHENMCAVTVEIENRKIDKAKRISPEKPFEKKEDGRRAIKSLCKLCEMYEWRLWCKQQKGKIIYSVELPIYNIEPLKFREIEIVTFERTVSDVMKLFKRDMEKRK